MKRIGFALLAAATIGIAHAAVAADMKLPVKAPPLVAAPPACDSRSVQSGLFFGGSLGWANTDSERSLSSVISLGGPDAFSGGPVSASDSSFMGGVFVGYNGPCMLIGSQPIVLGIEGNFDWLRSNTSTLTGTPTSALGAGPGSDTYLFSDNRLYTVTGLIHVPVTANLDIFGRVGWAWGNKDVTYNCNGFCTVAAGIAAFSATQSVDFSGWIIGVGVQTPLQTWFSSLPPMFLRIEYNHVFFGDQTVVLGSPATVQVAYRVNQDIDLVKLGLVVPQSTLGWR